MLKNMDWNSSLYPQRKWELDKAKELLKTANVILFRGAKGIGKSFFIDRLVDEISFNNKQIFLPVQCQEGEVNDIHQMGRNLSSEIQELNFDSKAKARKKSRFVNFSIAGGGAILGPFSAGVGFLFTALGLGIEFKGVVDEYQQKKKYNSGKGFTQSALEEELSHAIEKGNLENITIVLKNGEFLDAVEQESLAILISTFKQTNVAYNILLEAPTHIEFDALLGSKDVDHHTFTLTPIEDISSQLRLVFPSISDAQIAKLQDSSAGSPQVIQDTIERIIDDEAFFESTVNTSSIIDVEFDIEIQNHVLEGDYAFNNIAIIERNFKQLRKPQQDFLIALAATAKEYSIELLNNHESKYQQRYTELVESNKWFNTFASIVRFKSESIREFLLTQTPKEGLSKAFHTNLIVQIEAIINQNARPKPDIQFRLAKQLLLLERSEPLLLSNLMVSLIETKNRYYVTQLAVPLYQYIAEHGDFTESELDEKFSYILISTMDSVPDDISMDVLQKLNTQSCLTASLLNVYLLYTKGEIDQAVKSCLALIQQNQSLQIQLWLHKRLYDFLSQNMQEFKVAIKRTHISKAIGNQDVLQTLRGKLSDTSKLISQLNTNLLTIADKSPEIRRDLLWLSVLIERQFISAGGHVAITEKMASRLTSLSKNEAVMCELIDINDYAINNTALFVKKRDIEGKRKAQETKKILIKRMNTVTDDVVALFKQGELDREQWIIAINYFYWLTHYDPSWLKKDNMIDAQNALREVFSYRDVNKLNNSVHNYEALVRLSRVEVAFYVEHSKGILVDRAINILQSLLLDSVFRYKTNKLFDFSKLSQLIKQIDDHLAIGEYPKLKANFLSYYVGEAISHAGNDSFANNQLMKLCSNTAKYFEYLKNYEQAELFYQKENALLQKVKNANTENSVYTEIITLLNMTATSLNLGKSATRLATVNKRLMLIEDKLSIYSNCRNLLDYSKNPNFKEYQVRHTLSVVKRMAEIYVKIGNTSKALYFCGVAERILLRFRKGDYSRSIVRHKINAYLLGHEYKNAFSHINEHIAIHGASFVTDNIATILTLLAKSDYKSIEESEQVVSSLQFVLQSSSGVNAGEIILLKPLHNLLEAAEAHFGLFPFHPQLVQPWNTRQSDVRQALAKLRASLENTGEKASWILELLYLLANLLPENAEWYRQLGLALLTDSRFPTKAKLDRYKKFEYKAWGEDWLLNKLLISTSENWGRFIHIHKKQRKMVIKEIYDSLKHLYSLHPNEQNKTLLIDILKRESNDHYMVFKRLIRHSNNRSNEFTHEEMEKMFSELKKQRLTLRREFKDKFGNYSNKKQKKSDVETRSSVKRVA